MHMRRNNLKFNAFKLALDGTVHTCTCAFATEIFYFPLQTIVFIIILVCTNWDKEAAKVHSICKWRSYRVITPCFTGSEVRQGFP